MNRLTYQKDMADSSNVNLRMQIVFRHCSSPSSRVFKCKTCYRQFESFQALGGHRASHKKLRCDMVDKSKSRGVHECAICGLSFEIGQALGGHMRRHRTPKRPKFMFDLNFPPPDNIVDHVIYIG